MDGDRYIEELTERRATAVRRYELIRGAKMHQLPPLANYILTGDRVAIAPQPTDAMLPAAKPVRGTWWQRAHLRGAQRRLRRLRMDAHGKRVDARRLARINASTDAAADATRHAQIAEAAAEHQWWIVRGIQDRIERTERQSWTSSGS